MNSQVKFLDCYNNFISQLKIIFPQEDTILKLDSINELSNETKINMGQEFTNLISDKYIDMFLKCKIKIFSHKETDTKAISESLFGSNFCLKNLLNNQPEEVKKIIWGNLHKICLFAEIMKPEQNRDSNKVNLLCESLNVKIVETESTKPLPDTHERLKQMLGVEVNSKTNDMITDIVGSFEKVLGGSNANPIAGIMEVSNKISTKYAEQIKNGDIELDKLMESITTKVPGMDKLMKGMMDGPGKQAQKEKVIIDENFSTASVKIGELPKEKSDFKLADMLKMADQFGVIPGGKQTEIPNNIPHMGKIMELMSKLEKAETKEQAEELKQEMDKFMEKDLGIDINMLNNQITSATEKFNEK
jgi:hypothetical protein